jgi:transcriptional regulator with XRE-family HTH domain
MRSPAVILAKALKPFDGVYRAQVAQRAGVAIGTLNRAAGGRPISADHYLRIAAAVGIDPVTGQEVSPHVGFGEFDRLQLAMAIRMNMTMRKHSLRAAAKLAGVSTTVLLRLKNGEITAIESVLAGCRYLGLHPFGYLKPVPANVLRETSAGTAGERNAA